MKPRSIRSVLLACAAAAAGLVVISSAGGPAEAATVNQTLSCSPGGNQSVGLVTTAPAAVTAGGTFTVVLAPNGGGKADGAEIKNMVTTFRAPAESEVVPGSATWSGGSGSLGTISTSISGQDVSIKTTGPVSNGASFTPPTLSFQLKATGAAGTNLVVAFRQSAAYTLTVAGSINVSCNAATPLATLTSTSIVAPTTTTTTTSTSTTTSTTTTSTSTTTTSTSSTTTTTTPPETTTATWSPTGACGTVQTTTAPAGTTSVEVTAVGGSGGRGGSQSGGPTAAGGIGGQAIGRFPASGGQTYSAIVGCDGTDGGAASNTATPRGYAPGGGAGRGSIVAGTAGASAGSGGGASAACLGSLCSSTVVGSSPLVVAGGGGGAGVSNCAGTTPGAGGSGGSGSSTSGGNGSGPSGAKGTTASSAGGPGGVNSTGGPAYGGSNADGTGGAGVNVVGGGGGGGFAGGGQGVSTNTGCKGAGGGGGGSSWVRVTGTAASFATNATAKVVLVFTYVTSGTCTPDTVPFSSIQALVTQQYRDLTGASPTSAQYGQWVPAITTCSATADELIVSLLPSDLTTDEARLVRLYLAYFNRPPDPGGFAYWQRQLDAGRGLINAARKFAESSEFERTYGTVSNGAFVDLVYRNVLGRAPDAAGRTFWLTRLDNRTKNRGDVMINVSESSENVRKKTDHVQVFRLYRSMLRAFPSKASYLALLDPITGDGKALTDAARTIRLSTGYRARF